MLSFSCHLLFDLEHMFGYVETVNTLCCTSVFYISLLYMKLQKQTNNHKL